tara:strand:- start:571 stop:792 length:222 start_codon:yes stop_codon:yes gene_type:complete
MRKLKYNVIIELDVPLEDTSRAINKTREEIEKCCGFISEDEWKVNYQVRAVPTVDELVERVKLKYQNSIFYGQ